jgi:hypothetical protein
MQGVNDQILIRLVVDESQISLEGCKELGTRTPPVF